jgi:hypothetical protein
MLTATAATSLPWGAAESCLRASSLGASAAPDVFPASPLDQTQEIKPLI